MTSTTGSLTPNPRSTPAPGAPPSARRRRRNRRGSAAVATTVAASVLAGGLAMGFGTAPAGAAEPPPPDRRFHLCDPSGCLYTWGTVDSDGDGVTHADEVVAGTDPQDPASRPGLRDLVDLAAEHRLPSFDNGFAAFVALPAELVALNERTGGDRLERVELQGFALPERASTLKRLGIDEGQMEEMGIDIGRSGFTLGLEAERKDDSGLPARRIGGVTLEMISAGEAGHGGAEAGHGGADDGGKDHGGDAGGVEELTPLDPIVHTDGKTTDGIYGPITTYADGAVKVVQTVGGETTGVMYAPNGTVENHWTIKRYTNPDADQAVIDQKAAFESWKRMLGATKRTMEGWAAPAGEPGDIVDRKTLIAYVEDDLNSLTVVALDAPRVTSAQPETRPDLPNPLDRLTTGGVPGSGDGCGAGSFCG